MNCRSRPLSRAIVASFLMRFEVVSYWYRFWRYCYEKVNKNIYFPRRACALG